ncbi:hypothetical protein [Bradyrhizobium sp. RDM4]
MKFGISLGHDSFETGATWLRFRETNSGRDLPAPAFRFRTAPAILPISW